MKRVLALILFSIIFNFNYCQAQQWTRKYFQNGKLGNADSLVSNFRNVMQKEIGKEAPDLNFFPILKNESDSLENYLGKPTILMFWNTRCSGCEKQMTELKHLSMKNKHGLNIIYLSHQSKKIIKNPRGKPRGIQGKNALFVLNENLRFSNFPLFYPEAEPRGIL